jgi:hypothetical protein
MKKEDIRRIIKEEIEKALNEAPEDLGIEDDAAEGGNMPADVEKLGKSIESGANFDTAVASIDKADELLAAMVNYYKNLTKDNPNLRTPGVATAIFTALRDMVGK